MKNFFVSVKHYLKRYNLIYKIYIEIRRPLRIRAIQNQGLSVIKTVDSIFADLGIKYFLDFGTLLGFIREHTFIAHDLDIDLGVLKATDLERKKIEEYMLRNGFKKVHEFIFKNTVVEQAYILKGVKADLFYYEHTDVSSYCYGFSRLPEKSYSEPDDFSTFKFTYTKIDDTEYRIVNNMKISVPQNPEELLSQKYGDNWRTPDKSWTVMDAPTIIVLDDLGRIVKCK